MSAAASPSFARMALTELGRSCIRARWEHRVTRVHWTRNAASDGKSPTLWRRSCSRSAPALPTVAMRQAERFAPIKTSSRSCLLPALGSSILLPVESMPSQSNLGCCSGARSELAVSLIYLAGAGILIMLISRIGHGSVDKKLHVMRRKTLTYVA